MNSRQHKTIQWTNSADTNQKTISVIGGRANQSSAPFSSGEHQEKWAEMQPLFSPRKDPSKYPMLVLPDVVHDAIVDVRRLTQAPTSLVAASVLASANLAAHAHADVVMRDGRRVPISLFFLTEALSGERKSTVDRLVLAPHYAREMALQELAQKRRDERRAELFAWKDRRRAFAIEGRQNKVGVSPADISAYRKAFLEKVGAPPEPWEGEPLLIARDLTSEGLVKQLMVWPSIGVFSDEGAVFFGGITMNKDNSLKTTGIFSELWDGKGVNRVRSQDGATVARDKRLAMHLLCQPVVFQKFVAHNYELKGQGFVPRCLLTRVESTIGYRPYREEGIEDAPALQIFLERVAELLKTQPIEAQGGKSRVKPRAMLLSDDAHELYVEFYNQIEEGQRPKGRYREITGAASKALEQTLRLSATLQLMEDPYAYQIEARVFEGAFEVIHFHLNEVLRMEQEGRLDPDLLKAEILLNWIKEERLIRIKPSQVIQLGPNRLRGSTSDAKRYLQILADHGYLRLLPNATNSKWVEYLVNPKLFEIAR
jgi:hypothetical protein